MIEAKDQLLDHANMCNVFVAPPSIADVVCSSHVVPCIRRSTSRDRQQLIRDHAVGMRISILRVDPQRAYPACVVRLLQPRFDLSASISVLLPDIACPMRAHTLPSRACVRVLVPLAAALLGLWPIPYARLGIG